MLDADAGGVIVPKVCGADVELGAFSRGSMSSRPSDAAARALLREIDGLPRSERSRGVSYASTSYGYWSPQRYASSSLSTYDPQDWGRKFLASNGGCAYIDLGHLELCQPEVVSAFDHVACWHAMLRIARRALDAANANRPDDHRITVLVNNSDGHGNSYGSHQNFLVTRRTWDNIFDRKLHQLLYLAAYQTSSIVFTGQGKVGSENGAPPAAYQISQRADFMESLAGSQTTYRRPIVNSRDEPLCGPGATERAASDPVASALARVHAIFFDSTLCHVASLLKVGVMQIVLAMIEAGQVNPGLILDEPLQALRAWSHDPTLRARARMASGEMLTAVELQLRFFEEAQQFAEREDADRVVPRLGEILTLWHDTLRLLEARDFESLASRLDWVLKQAVLRNVLDARPDLDWNAPAIKHLDHVYSSLDLSEGLYWAFEREGRLIQVVSDAAIERFEHEPPSDTRAWTRAMLLRRADEEAVEDVNWDVVRLRTRGRWSSCRTVPLTNPLAGTEAEMSPLFEAAATVDDLIDSLGGHSELGAASVVPARVEGLHSSYEGRKPS